MAKSSDELTETLLEAMDTVIGARLQQLPYDKTIICTIMDDTQRGLGKYRVSADGVSLFTAYADSDIEYYKDTQVYVKIINNNTSISRIITGKYINTTDTYTSSTGIYGKFYPYQKDHQDGSLGFGCNNSNYKTNEKIIGTINSQLIPYRGYSGMKLTLQYRQNGLSSIKTARLRLQVIINDDVDIKYNSRRKTLAFDSGDEIYLPVNNILNNSTLTASYSTYFYFNNCIDIHTIKLIVYFDNVNLNDTDEAEFILDSYSLDFGYWLKTLGPNNDALIILPVLNNETGLTSQQYDDNSQVGQIFTYQYLYVNEDKILLENDLLNDPELRDSSFKYVINPSNTYNKKRFFGIYDATYEPKEENNVEYSLVPRTDIAGYWRPLTWDNETTGRIIYDLNTTVESIKLGLFFEYNRDGWGILRAQDFYLYNSSFTSKLGSVTRGLIASFDDTTNGNYFIYDKDGNLLNTAEADKERSLIIQYVNRSNENDSLNQYETCEWNFTTDNTETLNSSSMIIPILDDNSKKTVHLESGAYVFQFKYKIKKTYNQNYNTNTIKCTIVHGGTKYEFEQELLFGYSGSEENKYTIRVNYQPIDGTSKIRKTHINNSQNNDGNDAPITSITTGIHSSDLDINVYDYNNSSIQLNSNNITLNLPLITATIGSETVMTYFAPAWSSHDNYTYNGPTLIIYDDWGSIKYNKTKCVIKDMNNDNNEVPCTWSVSQYIVSPTIGTYFSLESDGKFTPAKICDVKTPKVFILIATRNSDRKRVWQQTIIFMHNENITSTQPGTSTSKTVTMTNNNIITNVTLGHINEEKTAGLIIADVQESASNNIINYGMYAYKTNNNVAEQIFALTESGNLSIGASGNKYSDSDTNLSGYNQILQGKWRVSESATADTLANVNIGAANHFTYINNNGAPITSNSTIGTSQNPVYINEGEITPIGTFNIKGVQCTLAEAFARLVAALDNAKPNSGSSVWP